MNNLIGDKTVNEWESIINDAVDKHLNMDKVSAVIDKHDNGLTEAEIHHLTLFAFTLLDQKLHLRVTLRS